MNQKEIGQIFKDRRKNLGLTLDDICERSGKSKGYLSNFENGNLAVQIDTLHDLCKAYKLNQKFEPEK